MMQPTRDTKADSPFPATVQITMVSLTVEAIKLTHFPKPTPHCTNTRSMDPEPLLGGNPKGADCSIR